MEEKRVELRIEEEGERGALGERERGRGGAMRACFSGRLKVRCNGTAFVTGHSDLSKETNATEIYLTCLSQSIKKLFKNTSSQTQNI